LEINPKTNKSQKKKKNLIKNQMTENKQEIKQNPSEINLRVKDQVKYKIYNIKKIFKKKFFLEWS